MPLHNISVLACVGCGGTDAMTACATSSSCCLTRDPVLNNPTTLHDLTSMQRGPSSPGPRQNQLRYADLSNEAECIQRRRHCEIGPLLTGSFHPELGARRRLRRSREEMFPQPRISLQTACITGWSERTSRTTSPGHSHSTANQPMRKFPSGLQSCDVGVGAACSPCLPVPAIWSIRLWCG